MGVNLDPDASVIMVLMNERMAAQETIERQRAQFRALVTTV